MLIPRSIIVASAALASSAFANTPPEIPPEPTRLAAAEQLVSVLPLEKALSFFIIDRMTNEVANDAMGWLGARQCENCNDTVKRIFYEKVRIESRSQLTLAIIDANEALVERYARRLSVRNLEAARTFAATPEGSAFLEVQLGADAEIHHRIIRFMYDRISSNFPYILQSARDSGQLLEDVNRDQ